MLRPISLKRNPIRLYSRAWLKSPDPVFREIAVIQTNLQALNAQARTLGHDSARVRLSGDQLAWVQILQNGVEQLAYQRRVEAAEQEGIEVTEDPPEPSTALNPIINSIRGNSDAILQQARRWTYEAQSLQLRTVDQSQRIAARATEDLPAVAQSILVKPDPRPFGRIGYFMLLNVSTQTLHNCAVFTAAEVDAERVAAAEHEGMEPPSDPQKIEHIQAWKDFLGLGERRLFFVRVLPPRTPVYMALCHESLLPGVQSASITIYCDELTTGQLSVGDLYKRAEEIKKARFNAIYADPLPRQTGPPPPPPLRRPAQPRR